MLLPQSAAALGVLDELQRLEQALRRSQTTLDANESEYSRLGQALKSTQTARQAAQAEQRRLQRIHVARLRRLLQ
ncbi:MAG: hypothetical protein EON47_14315, partial [Acetobacteraceae bacterium]